jgi:hypothetical protein
VGESIRRLVMKEVVFVDGGQELVVDRLSAEVSELVVLAVMVEDRLKEVRSGTAVFDSREIVINNDGVGLSDKRWV